MSATWERSIVITQNADVPFSWGYTTNTAAAGLPAVWVPYSFVGTTTKFTLKETNSPSSPTLLQLTSTSGAITYTIATVKGVTAAFLNWSIPNATTVTLPVGTWWFDLLWLNGSQQSYLAEGPGIVQGTGGR
jgi:hypothetical protein